MGDGASGPRQPAAVDHTGARRDWIQRWTLSLTEFAIQRALDNNRATERTVRALDSMYTTVVFSPNSDEGHVEIEPTEREL